MTQTGSYLSAAEKPRCNPARPAPAHWVMDYVSDSAQVADPVDGNGRGGADTQSQVRLHFDTRDEAIAFAEANGLTYQLEIPHQRRIKPKAYADNFKFSRWENWTH